MLRNIARILAVVSVLATVSIAAKSDIQSVEAKDFKLIRFKNLQGGIICVGDYAFFAVGTTPVQLMNKSGKPMGCEEAKKDLIK
jgi:hypothetical protein